METNNTRAPLSDYLTIRDIARHLGASYYTAYGLAASGLFGDPLVIGRQYFFRRSIAEDVIRKRLAQRQRRVRTTPHVEGV